MTPLSLHVLMALAQACAPSVAPETLLSVVRTESGFDPLTIGVNGAAHRSLHPSTAREALRVAADLTARGANLDLGLAQINARNLSDLGLSLAEVFDPCRNLAGGARILTGDYASARRSASEPQAALRVALSLYNSGDATRGMRNGYVAKVYRAAAQVVPAIAAAGSRITAEAEHPTISAPSDRPEPAKREPEPAPPLDVFARPTAPALVWSARALTPWPTHEPARRPTLLAGDAP